MNPYTQWIDANWTAIRSAMQTLALLLAIVGLERDERA